MICRILFSHLLLQVSRYCRSVSVTTQTARCICVIDYVNCNNNILYMKSYILHTHTLSCFCVFLLKLLRCLSDFVLEYNNTPCVIANYMCFSYLAPGVLTEVNCLSILAIS